MAWNREEVVKDCIEELSCENEVVAKSMIKSILQGIITQQKIIVTANTRIAELQESLKTITVNPVSL